MHDAVTDNQDNLPRRMIRLLRSPSCWPNAIVRRLPSWNIAGRVRSSLRGGTAPIRRHVRMRLTPLAPAPARRKLFPYDVPVRHGGWKYHDENWVRVIHRFEHRRMLREGRALVVRDHEQEPGEEVICRDDGSIAVDVAANTQQEWVWLYLDPAEQMWRNFRWELTARRETDFRELQFAFRYIDFYNRYRFRHEHDHLHFDIVVNGQFRNSIHKVPFRMELGREYRYEVEVRDERFVLSVDGVVMLDEVDEDRLFPRGSIAVILWEDDAKTPIRAEITGIEVVET